MWNSKKKNNNWIVKYLTHTFSVISINRSSLEERKITEFKGYQLLALAVYSSLLIMIISFCLIAYSPIKSILPQAELDKKKKIIELMIHIDSLERDLFIKAQYVNAITRIINGDIIDSVVPIFNKESIVYEDLTLSPSKADSILRKEVTDADLYNIPSSYKDDLGQLEDFVFYKPVDGLITSLFNPQEQHFGLDIVTETNASVKSCLDGVVLFADWSSSKGNVIIIQHVDNIVSAYMHNALLVKETNDLVRAGEVIGVVGNSGELTSGPHLHFELWQNGTPINPVDYIDF